MEDHPALVEYIEIAEAMVTASIHDDNKSLMALASLVGSQKMLAVALAHVASAIIELYEVDPAGAWAEMMMRKAEPA